MSTAATSRPLAVNWCCDPSSKVSVPLPHDQPMPAATEVPVTVMVPEKSASFCSAAALCILQARRTRIRRPTILRDSQRLFPSFGSIRRFFKHLCPVLRDPAQPPRLLTALPRARVVVAFCINGAKARCPGDAPESSRPAAGVARSVGGRRSSVHRDAGVSSVDSLSDIGDTLLPRS
jgi:hypothetical protein